MTASAEVPVRGEVLIAPVDRVLRSADRRSARFLPVELDPLAQLGALANLSLIVAVVTGVLLLFFYVPSVQQAYDSMVAMDAAPYTSGLIRSLHRYSSDACMLFVLLHALKIFAARRFTGPRWFAWVTGLAALAMLWLVGYLGYWLVWDQRAQQIAVGAARVLDVVPVFTDPMERSFLTDETVNSLLFFIVFFVHMLLPLAMGIGLWLHIARLNKAAFLPGRTLAIWAVASLVILSIVRPAAVADAARMVVQPTGFTMDYWYLLPVVLTDRLSGGFVWLVVALPALLVFTVPWWMSRGRPRPAQVDVSRCNSCGQCAIDCPYDAITMVPRTDGKSYPMQSQVDPAKCVGCGICAGSCDSMGVGLHDWFPVRPQRALLERWADEAPGAPITLVCAHAGAAVGPRTLEVPCAGWIHVPMLERVLCRDLVEVRIVACGDGDCRYRHGPMLLAERLAGERRPSLRTDRVEPERVVVTPQRATPSRLRAVLAGVVAVLIFGGATWLGSDLPYSVPGQSEPQLVVSFHHPGAVRLGRLLTPAEKARYPAYMKREREILRAREPVRLRIRVDGVVVHERAYPANGLWHDGNSIAIVRLPVPAGRHRVEVAIGDTHDAGEWPHVDAATLEFSPRQRRVVLFDRVEGFRWSAAQTEP